LLQSNNSIVIVAAVFTIVELDEITASELYAVGVPAHEGGEDATYTGAVVGAGVYVGSGYGVGEEYVSSFSMSLMPESPEVLSIGLAAGDAVSKYQFGFPDVVA